MVAQVGRFGGRFAFLFLATSLFPIPPFAVPCACLLLSLVWRFLKGILCRTQAHVFHLFGFPLGRGTFLNYFRLPRFPCAPFGPHQRTSSGIFQQCFRFFMFVHVQSRNTFLSSATALRPPASFFRPRGPEGYTTNGGTNICTSLAGPGPPLNPSATKL